MRIELNSSQPIQVRRFNCELRLLSLSFTRTSPSVAFSWFVSLPNFARLPVMDRNPLGFLAVIDRDMHNITFSLLWHRSSDEVRHWPDCGGLVLRPLDSE